MKDRYLGDGVYASFDGYQIWLDLRAQPPTAGMTKIALNNDTVNALVNYRNDVREYERSR